VDYIYELREGGAVVATSHLLVADELAAGERVPFGSGFVTVREVRPSLGGMTIVVLERDED
jgi:hypothetical protein